MAAVPRRKGFEGRSPKVQGNWKFFLEGAQNAATLKTSDELPSFGVPSVAPKPL